MKILSKIKHLNILSSAKGILSSGRAKLNNLSTKNKAIIATGLSIITVGGAAAATSSIINNNSTKEIDNSVIYEAENSNEVDNDEFYGPELKGEIPTNVIEEKEEEKKEEFLSDELKDVEIKDEEDKKEEITEDITNEDSNIVIVKEYTAIPTSSNEEVQGEEIVERVEYSRDDVTIVDGKAYEPVNDTVEIVDNNNYVPGPDGDYYISNEDIENINMGEVITEDIYTVESSEDVYTEESGEGIYTDETYVDEIDLSKPFYPDPTNPNKLWGSEEDYLLSIDPTYNEDFDIDKEEEKYLEETSEEVVSENNEIITSDEIENIVIGPDGQVYESLDEYNSKVEETIEESTKTETVIEDVKEVKDEITGETEVAVKPSEPEKEDNTTRKEEEVKIIFGFGNDDEETKTSEETKVEENEDTEEIDFDLLELLEGDAGKLQADGEYWVSEEDYNLVHSQEAEATSKTR